MAMPNTKLQMNQEAAQLAANQVRAPMVPATNTRLPRPPQKKPPQNSPQMVQPQGQMQMPQPIMRMGPASAVKQNPTAGMAAPNTTMTGQMVVSGPGERKPIGNETQKDITNRLWRGEPNAPSKGPRNPNQFNDRVTDPTPGGDTRDLYDSVVEDLLTGGVRDTADEEAVLRDEMQRSIGQGQGDLMARMSGAGFGTSGVASALSSDLNSQAASDAARAIQDVRQGARDDYRADITTGLDSAATDRRLDMSEDQYERYLSVLSEIFGDGATDDGGVGAADVLPDSGLTTGWGDTSTPASSGDAPKSRADNASGGFANPIVVSSPPPGAQRRGNSRDGGTVYTVVENGELVYYVVR